MKQIFIHGLGQIPDCWSRTITLLKTEEYSVCPNLADIVHGKEVTYQNLYEAFSAICNEADEPIDLCGLSLGGVLALNYAVEHSEKVRTLALIAAQYKMPKLLLKFQNILFRLMPKSMFQQMGFAKSEFLQLCRTMMELDFTDSLRNISCPVEVICGAKDTANKRASVELAGILANAELRVLDGAGHEVNIETPEKLAEILQEFYNRVLELLDCKQGL